MIWNQKEKQSFIHDLAKHSKKFQSQILINHILASKFLNSSLDWHLNFSSYIFNHLSSPDSYSVKMSTNCNRHLSAAKLLKYDTSTWSENVSIIQLRTLHPRKSILPIKNEVNIKKTVFKQKKRKRRRNKTRVFYKNKTNWKDTIFNVKTFYQKAL